MPQKLSRIGGCTPTLEEKNLLSRILAGAGACVRPAHLLSCSVGSRLHHGVLVISLLARFAQNSKYDAKMTEQQRPKKAELSGWQLSTRKNFPDEARKSFS